MAGLNSWLSPAVLHALGWALIHSLWQGAAVAAVAALAMAFMRRPAVRYLIGVGALALMLAAPMATFLVLTKPVAPVPVLQPRAASVLPATPLSPPVAVLATADRAIGAMREAPRQLPVTDLLPWLVAAWACGVAFFSLRFAGGFLLLEHRRRTQSHAPGAPVLALCLDLQKRLGLDRAIQYLECGWVEAPAVIGWLRPAVLLPVFALTGLSEEQFRAVIAHELAHIRRHDWLVNLFQVLVESLLFYHPAMWWLNRRIRIERELCCDEIAVSLTGSRLEYARALAHMAEWKNVSLLAMAANRRPLTRRILHILGRNPGAGQRVAGLTGGMLFLAAALAAANLLFGIAYPVQMAHAKESVRVALVSSQAVVADLARKVVLTAKDTAPPTVAPDQMDAPAESTAEGLAAPPSDVSRLLPDKNLVTPTVVASNDPAATPVLPSPNVSTAVALHDQPAMQPATSDPSVGQVQAGASMPPAAPPRLDPNAPYKRTGCGFITSGVGSGFVAGRVTSSTTIQMPKLSCAGPGAGAGGDAGPGVSFPMGPPCDGTHSIRSSIWGLYCPNVPWATMTVQLAKPADASKMPVGKVVALKGDFFVIIQNNVQYWGVQNARVLYVDPFDRQAANAPPATTPDDQAISLASAAAAGPVSAPRTRTQPALECLLAVGAPLCRNLFEKRAVEAAIYCAREHVFSTPGIPTDYCPYGPLEAVDYLGTNAAGADVYEVKFRNTDAAYVITPPGPNGKIGQYWIKLGPLNAIIPPSLVHVTSAHKIAVYRRPAEWSDPTGRHAANEPPATTPDDQSIPLASVAVPGQASAPRTRTEPYLGCYLGFGSWTCPSYLVTPLWWCGEEYAQRHARDCIEGPLEQVDYLGTNAAGADVYAVKFRNVDMTYVVAPPGPDGKKGAIWIRRGNPNGLAASPLVAVTSRAGAGLIYKRTATDGGAQANPSDRHAANAPPATTPVDQPVAPPATTRELAAGPVQAALRTLPATPAKLDSNEPYKITRCKNVVYGLGPCDLVTLTSATAPEPGKAPRSKTELAMKCWLGVVEYNGCWQSDGCDAAGPVQRVEYLGSTATGGEVYQVRYQFEINAYVILPDPKGNADQYFVKPTDRYWIKREISPPAAPILIYKRPETAQLHLCHRDWDRQYAQRVAHSWLSNAPTVPGARP